MDVLFATKNDNKLKEIRQILSDTGLNVISLKDKMIDINISEDGDTFEENAKIKALALRPYFDGIILADDSGLEIDALDKNPGVRSARFMGENTPYEIKNRALLKKLENTPCDLRKARFKCAVAISLPQGMKFSLNPGDAFPESVTEDIVKKNSTEEKNVVEDSFVCVTGVMEGYIAHEMMGENGFGYDPIFYLPEYGKTAAQLPPEKKNMISHRGKALQKAKDVLNGILPMFNERL